MTTTAAEALAEDRKHDLPITFDMAAAVSAAPAGSSRARRSRRPGSTASTGCRSARGSSTRWRPGPAAPGRSSTPAALAKGLKRPARPRRLDRRVDRAGALLRHGPRAQGLPVQARPRPLLRHVRRRDGGPTHQSSRRRSSMPSSARTAGPWPSFAASTCYVVDIAAPAERALTTGGTETLRHGHRRLGLFRGDLQSPLAGVLVEPRLEEDRVHGVRRRGRGHAHDARRHQESPQGRAEQVSPLGRAEPEGPARDRRRASGGPVRWADLNGLLVRRLPDQPRRLVGRQLRGVLLRPGSDPDVARPGQDRRGRRQPEGPTPVPRQHQGLDRRPGADHLPEGRLVPLDQRAGRLEAPVPLCGRRDPQGPGDGGRVGGPLDRSRRSGLGLDLLHGDPRLPDGDRTSTG